MLSSAIAHYTGKGNFRRAATHQQNLAELYELELGDEQKAVEAYETAASWYEADNAESLANKYWLKVADLAALAGDYGKSIGYYEKVAKHSVESNLMKWSVKDYLLKAGICHLASGVRDMDISFVFHLINFLRVREWEAGKLTISGQDTVATSRALESYRQLDNTFASTREHQLLVDMAEAVEEAQQEMFADKLFQYDQLSKLDKWKTTLLLRVKESIQAQEEDFS